MPPFFDDPDEDFVHWVPEWMPEGMNVIGRLDEPDQAEVRGGFSLPAVYPSGPQDAGLITIEWSFTRTRLPDQP